jgi:uncharacterized protein (TIGR02421 family)
MAPKKPSVITDRLIGQIRERISANQTVRRTLPDGGRIHIDRQLPFLVVYRPPLKAADIGTARLVRGEASYLIAPRAAKHRSRVSALVSSVADEALRAFGGFLIVEVWSAAETNSTPVPSGELHRLGFRVIVPRSDAEATSVSRLVTSLGKIRVLGQTTDVTLAPGGRLSPPGMPRLERSFGTGASPVRVIGIEVQPTYRDPTTGELLPEVMRSIHRQLSRALQQCAYEFALNETTHQPRHYQALGRRAMVRAVSLVDGQLAAVASGFDLLLMVTPVNTEQAYRSFRRNKAQKPPTFRYRPLDIDPSQVKRALYQIPIERVEDPTLAAIFREKQRELSLKLDLLSDRRTKRFLHTGVALYGDVDRLMMLEATEILDRLPASLRRTAGPKVDAAALAASAQLEIDHYRERYPELNATVQLRPDVTSLMVSSGSLLVGSGMQFTTRRVNPLIQHEVGTHVVTYWNGAAQRLKLLATGLAGHDELQEGLAVLAEYLVDGLTPSRLRTLAGRVVAARSIRDGAAFTDTYRLMADENGFGPRAAFQMAMRVHRGGGFVKDAVYLRGLQRVVGYLADGGRLDTLLVGKIALNHVAVIEELQRRGVLVNPPLRPAYLDDPDTYYRLERLREGISLVDLAN